MSQEVSVRSIAPRELHRRWQSGEFLEVIDVRLPAAFAEAHLPMARSLPFQEIDPEGVRSSRSPSGESSIYVVCQIGRLSVDACRLLIAAGVTDVVNVDGGTEAWRSAGLPLAREAVGIGLRRQLQLLSAGLILGGSTLGLLVHPLLLAIALLGVAGLLCARAGGDWRTELVLAKMPWNRKRSSQ